MRVETMPKEIEEKVPTGEESETFKNLKEKFGEYFDPADLEKIQKNPDLLYFRLPNIFNKLSKEGKWNEIDNLQKESLRVIQEKPEREKTFEFPAKKSLFLERFKNLPRSLKAAFLGLGFLTLSATSLEASYRAFGKEIREEAKVVEVAKPEEVGGLCTENMCQVVTREDFDKKRKDLKNFLAETEEFSKLSAEEQKEQADYFEETYNFLKNKFSDQEKGDPEIKNMISQLEIKFAK